MKKRQVIAAGLNTTTGFGTGSGMRAQWGGWDQMLDGWFCHADVGCLDAPRAVPGGGMHAGAFDDAFQNTVMRDRP